MEPAHDDAQRALERRALGNVAALARRLGYEDALDRYAEKYMVITIGIVVFLVVSAVTISMMATQPDPRLAEVRRCELDEAVALVHEKRAELKARKPELTQAHLERLVTVKHDDVKSEAAQRCARGR